MKSIMDTSKDECYLCKTTRNIEEHHIFYGRGNRKISDKNGFVVFLCDEHHRGWGSVHSLPNEGLDLRVKEDCQAKYEMTHTRAEFMKLIGRNYL